MKGINLLPAPGLEAQVQIPGGRSPVNYVEVREAGTGRMLGDLGNAERRQHGLVEPDALGIVAGAKVDMVKDPERPVPAVRCLHARNNTSALLLGAIFLAEGIIWLITIVLLSDRLSAVIRCPGIRRHPPAPPS